MRSWKIPLLAAGTVPLLFIATPARADPPEAPTATATLPAPPAGPGPQAEPRRQDWKPGLPPPPGFRIVEKRPWPFVSGMAVFGSSWGFSLLLGGIAAGVGSNKAAAGVFMIPVVGPFIDLGWQKMTSDDAVFTGIVGGLQALGAASLIVGLVLPKKQRLVPGVADLHLSPIVTPQVGGLGLTGSF